MFLTVSKQSPLPPPKKKRKTKCKTKLINRLICFQLYRHYTQHSVRHFSHPIPALEVQRTDKQLKLTNYSHMHMILPTDPTPPHSTAIPTPDNAKNHTPGFTQGARTEAAHDAALRTAALLARTAFRVHADGAFCARVRAAYEAGAGAVGTAAGPGAGAASGGSTPASATAGASRNSFTRSVDAGGGANNTTGSDDAKLMARGAGLSHQGGV